MSKYFRKMGNNEMLSAILFIILGIVLILRPSTTVALICRVIGIVLAIYGVGLIITFFEDKEKVQSNMLTVVIGILIIVFGVYITIRPWAVVSIMNIIFAIVFLWHGVFDVAMATSLKDLDSRSWIPALIIGIITIAFGLITLFNPFFATSTLMRVVGIFFVCDGISKIWLEAI